MMYFKDSMQDPHTHILFQCDFEVPFHAILKNSKQMKMNFQTKKMYVGSSNRAYQMKEYLLIHLSQHRILNKINNPIDTFVSAQFTFYYPKDVFFNKQGLVSARVADLSNLYCSVEDALQASGIISNDRLIRNHDGSDRLPSDDGKYRVSILLTKAPQYETMEKRPKKKVTKGSRSWIHT